jgi:hypothetical protein
MNKCSGFWLWYNSSIGVEAVCDTLKTMKNSESGHQALLPASKDTKASASENTLARTPCSALLASDKHGCRVLNTAVPSACRNTTP